MRLNGADANTPVIPAMRPADDAIVNGTILDHVGYGLISYPNGQSSVRHHVLGNANQDVLGQLGLSPSLYISYLQTGGSGPCSGDSGGPNLVITPGGERVAGVISFGDQQCAQFGVSGRVSAVYDSFIAPYIGNPPPPDPSSSSSSGVGGATSSGGATVGAGGASTHWTAGSSDVDDNFDGDVVTSSCAMDPRQRGGGGWWLVLALGLALGLRGRRS
jgi:secreted trypsin-like serine protease